ncbi:MAG: hypothetical protein QME83_08590 [Thermodesulfobacteriota bacterium]|nr:hypothetical protein [Thermodesulfobacteriota bacterium]
MDVSQQNHHQKESLSRRMFLKVLGWLTMTGVFTKITGVAHSQEKSDVLSENVRFEGKGGRWEVIFPGLRGKGLIRGLL